MKIKITYVFLIFLILLAVISSILLVSSYRANKNVASMQEITNEYIAGQSSINEMREISDYLTEKCRDYIVTGKVDDAEAFFREIQVDKHREQALKSVEQYGKETEIYTSLEGALKASNELADVECYAMRLASESYGISPSDISDELAEVQLTRQDMALDKAAQLEKSRNMVFDEDYEAKKAEIWSGVYGSIDNLLKDTRDRQIGSYQTVQRLLKRDNVLLILLLLLTIAMVLTTARMVVIPLRNSSAFIRKNQSLPVRGSAEYMYLAESYNKMLASTQRHNEILSYEVTHDELTGLYNRKLFEEKRVELTGQDTAMIMVDVDYFKDVNDTYGHATGDEILKKVAGILLSSFRFEDYVCRIGGDEFAIIMVQMRPDLKNVILTKIESIRESLAIKDDLPKVTLSIGVAFSGDEDNADDSDGLYKKADAALYEAKERGRDGYAFYEDIDKQ
ncbi:MAG: GGDEF domain-containing protein [Bacillota bacterium]|nr:GGDEF domain-containing protein [Bacillota bacterium]